MNLRHIILLKLEREDDEERRKELITWYIREVETREEEGDEEQEVSDAA